MFEKVNDLWLKLIGSREGFSLESRIFHSIALGLLFLGVVYIPYNFFAGLYVGSASAFLLACIFGYQYYRSRYDSQKHSSLIFGLTGIAIFSINYFTNAGIDGSTDIIWPVYLLLLFTISPYKQHVWWLMTYLISFMLVHLVAFYYPHLVKHPFQPGEGELMDRITTLPLPVTGIYIAIKYLRKSYDSERKIAEEKAATVEASNQQITLQKQQLEQSDAEKSKLMSIISHDMRAPLIHIQGYLQLLTEQDLQGADRHALERGLLTATNATMDMLDNLLHWTKSQMEGIAVHLADLNLHDAITVPLEMGQTQATKKDIAFSTDINAAIRVKADTDMLQLVVRNLISNAIKFTPHGGAISVKAHLIGQECKITVSDTGKGIDPSKQQKIFSLNTDPAFGTNNEKGIGMGLLLCKEFIERQGGRIGFESIFGHGSSFYIFLPVASA